MLFSRSGVLNAFSTYNIFNLTIGLSGHNPILSQGKSLSLCACVCVCVERKRESRQPDIHILGQTDRKELDTT